MPVIPGVPGEEEVPGDTSPTYCDVPQLREALAPDGVIDFTSAAEIDDPGLQDAINDAQTEVDAKLGALYDVPFPAPYPPLVVSITRDIAVWLATLTHRKGNPLEPTDPTQLRYNRAEALLGLLVSGAITLDVAVAGQAAPVEKPQMVFNPDLDAQIITQDDAGLVTAYTDQGPVLIADDNAYLRRLGRGGL